jgi:hypothetical protein
LALVGSNFLGNSWVKLGENVLTSDKHAVDSQGAALILVWLES